MGGGRGRVAGTAGCTCVWRPMVGCRQAPARRARWPLAGAPAGDPRHCDPCTGRRPILPKRKGTPPLPPPAGANTSFVLEKGVTLTLRGQPLRAPTWNNPMFKGPGGEPGVGGFGWGAEASMNGVA